MEILSGYTDMFNTNVTLTEEHTCKILKGKSKIMTSLF